MSTQQILGVVGGVVGSFFGYPQLGFVVGSLVGAALTPKEKTEGPRLDDLKVTVSTYGGGIPTLYGTARIGGNVIWSTDKIEIPTTTETGKGGGSENTSYQYFVHMAIALCYGEIDGIRKVWQDGKLIFDASSGASIESAIASSTSPYSRLTLYLGTETQLPDPVQEIYLGAGNAPAYRGMAYVQLNAVECPGGRVPQYSFEVSSSLTRNTETDVVATAPRGFHGVGVKDAVWHTNFLDPTNNGNNLALEVFYGSSGVISLVRTIPLEFGVHSARTTFTPIPVPGALSPSSMRTRTAANQIDTYLDVIDLTTGEVTTIYTYTKEVAGSPLLSSQFSTASFDAVTATYVVMGGEGPGQSTTPVLIKNGAATPTTPVTGTPGVVGTYNGIAYILTAESGNLQIERRSVDDGSVLSTLVGPAVGLGMITSSAIYISEDGIFVYSPTLAGAAKIYKVSNGVWTETFNTPVQNPFQPASTNFYANDHIAIIGPTNTDYEYVLIHTTYDPAEVLVADIIAAQCTRAGLMAGQFSTTGIIDTVWGYVITNPASARTNIQPLMTGYGIDATEEDGKIKFFKRSAITSVVTVPYVELGCVEGGGDAGDPMPLSHGQEAELPRAVNVNYINPEFDYQTGTERAARQVTESQLDQTMDLPISTNANHAASVAQMILYDAWNERNKRSLKISRKYAAVSAGDGVTIEYPQGIEQRWRVTKVTDTGALCEWEVVPADESIYTQTSIGAPGYTGQQVAPLPTQARAQIIDTSILRDVDNGAGPYVALDGYGAGFAGAQLFVGPDTATQQSRGAVSSAAPIGFSENALGNWTAGIVDETNTLTVNVGDDTLSSVTRDVMLNGTTNVAVIGAPGRWEIIKFQTATSLGSGRYTLSGLLRGVNGTEHARASHLAGDTFVLMLINGLLRPNMEAGSIGQEMTYTAVAKGRPLSSAFPQTYASTGEGLKPRSPWDLRKSNAASNDQTLTWQRRTRLSSNALRGIVPLGETTEAYAVDFFTSGAFTTLAGTLLSSTKSLTITSAQQATFGLTPGATLHARVYQLSDAVGRGHELQGSV